jgi:hypothetical protein
MVPHCYRPVMAGTPGGELVTVYVCSTKTEATQARVPRYFPGRRIVRGHTIAVINGSAAFIARVRRIMVSMT